MAHDGARTPENKEAARPPTPTQGRTRALTRRQEPQGVLKSSENAVKKLLVKLTCAPPPR
jgi:hypothetical protein